MKKNESGQAIIGGLFFITLLLLLCWYFISVVNSVHSLYASTLKTRFHTLEVAAKYANILNQISFNNQNIISSIMSSQIAYIKSVETGLIVSHSQPYWLTYSSFQNKEKRGALSSESSRAIENYFKFQSYKSANGFYVAKALSDKNQKLLLTLPVNIQKFFSQSSVNESHCLALKFLESELTPSHYTTFVMPQFYQHGLTKSKCSLEHKTSFTQKLLSVALPLLSLSESAHVINFSEMESYSGELNSFLYGITYVKQESAREFIQELKWTTNGVLKTIIRITHPQFSCRSHTHPAGDFLIEEDWNLPCQISNNKFLKSFFTTSWSPIVTLQERGISKK